MNKSFLFLIGVILIISCNSKENNSPTYLIEIKNEVDRLSNKEQHNYFLETLYTNSYGKELVMDSLKKNFFQYRLEISKLQKEMDSLKFINLIKAKYYINKYDYPPPKKFSEQQYLSIYYVLLYSNSSSSQIEYYPIMKNLYKKEQLSEVYFLAYMSKTYYLKKGGFYNFNDKTSYQTMIKDLMPVLDTMKPSLK